MNQIMENIGADHHPYPSPPSRNIYTGLLWLYKATLSPLFGNVCKFEPSCSEYSAAAFQKYGFFKGAWLTVKRIARCHPFHPGGSDPLL